MCRGTEENRNKTRSMEIHQGGKKNMDGSGRISMEDWGEHFMSRLERTSQQQTTAGRWTEGEEKKDRK